MSNASFSENLRLLITSLGARESDIASYAGFDRTNISRFMSGRRTTSSHKRSGRSLIDGICGYAAANGKLEIIGKLCGAGSSFAENELKEHLANWLFDDQTNSLQNPTDSGIFSPDSFAARLDISMKLADISNIRLSRDLNVDASLISRYRRGIRTMYRSSELLAPLESILYSRIVKNGKKDELAAFIGADPKDVDLKAFSLYLSGSCPDNDNGSRDAAGILRIFEEFEPSLSEGLPSPETVISQALSYPPEESYMGIEGLRIAVLRLLSLVITGEGKELYLYSDQSMEWLTGDPVFLSKWVTLMFECVKKGVNIRIIHNLDRSIEEMNSAIKNWLPLYMSGMITPWYCKKVKNSRFSHTLFISPTSVCVEATIINGYEQEGLYHFHTDKAYLDIFSKYYRRLLSGSERLVFFKRPRPNDADGSVLILQDTMLAQMPEDLVADDISESSPEELKELAADYHECRIKTLPGPCFHNISLPIYRDYTCIVHLRNPKLTFYFDHPLLHRSFQNFLYRTFPDFFSECVMYGIGG